MPPEIAEAARFRQIQATLGIAVALTLVVVGLLYVHAHSKVASAQREVDQATQQQSILQSQLAGLASVQQTFTQVAARQSMLAQAMGSEVRWSGVLNDLSLRMPSNVWLTSLSVTETPPAVAAPTGPQTLGAAAPVATAPVPIGSITFVGVGLEHDDVATWLDAMARYTKFLDPIFTQSTEALIGTKSTVNFGSTASIDSLALSNRYVLSAPSTPTTPAAAQPGVTP